MFDRERCGTPVGPCSMHGVVHFTCPRCGAEHDRGYVDLRETFRCMRCGYAGTADVTPREKSISPENF